MLKAVLTLQELQYPGPGSLAGQVLEFCTCPKIKQLNQIFKWMEKVNLFKGERKMLNVFMFYVLCFMFLCFYVKLLSFKNLFIFHLFLFESPGPVGVTPYWSREARTQSWLLKWWQVPRYPSTRTVTAPGSAQSRELESGVESGHEPGC